MPHNSNLRRTNFTVQNWILNPAAQAVNESAPATINDQKWMIMISGILEINIRGGKTDLEELVTVEFTPNIRQPLRHALNAYGVSKPVELGCAAVFQVEQYVLHSSPNSFFNKGHSVNSGFTINNWRLHEAKEENDVVTNEKVNNIFSGIEVDIGVSDRDAELKQISFYATLTGKIRFIPFVPPPRPPGPRIADREMDWREIV